MAEKTLGTVVCTSTHPIDLDDGRELAPGQTVEEVDLDHPHNRTLVLDGSLVVTEGKVPRARHDEQLVSRAAEHVPGNTDGKDKD